VAGYRRWLELGRQVRKGETGIRILAPCRYRKRNVTETTTDDGADLVETVRKLSRCGGVRGSSRRRANRCLNCRSHVCPVTTPPGASNTLCDQARELGFQVALDSFDSPNKCGETNFANADGDDST